MKTAEPRECNYVFLPVYADTRAVLTVNHNISDHQSVHVVVPKPRAAECCWASLVEIYALLNCVGLPVTKRERLDVLNLLKPLFGLQTTH